MAKAATGTAVGKKIKLSNPNVTDTFGIAEAVVAGLNPQSQALRFAVNAEADKPMGTASIASCPGLVIALISDKKVKMKLLSFLGFQSTEDLLSLKDPCRVLSVLLSSVAYTALENAPSGPECHQLWEAVGAKCISLETNLEAQLNTMLKKAWNIEEDTFEPFSIVPEASVKDLIAALVSIEKIEVSWKEELDFYALKRFTTATGEKVDASFCIDKNSRLMNTLTFDGGEAVLLPCQVDDETGKERGMVFLLPPESDQNLQELLKALANHMDKTMNGLKFDPCCKVNFSFPAFDVTMQPATIVPYLKPFIPEIFDKMSGCMDGTLPREEIDGVAYIGDVQHGASIKADRKGATAKAVTVATVVTYRSLPTPPKEFHCNRPFVSILVELIPGTVDVKNIEFVTKHETAASLDLTVN